MGGSVCFTNPLIPYCYIYVITKKCKSTLHHLADRQTLQSESTLPLQSKSTLPNWLAGLNTTVQIHTAQLAGRTKHCSLNPHCPCSLNLHCPFGWSPLTIYIYLCYLIWNIYTYKLPTTHINRKNQKKLEEQKR